MKKEKPSRAEINKTIRQVLTRFKIDLNQLQIFCSPSSINLAGTLMKNTGDELRAEEIMNLKNELAHYGSLNTDLTNWDLTGGTIKKIERDSQGHKVDNEKKEKAPQK